MDQHQARLQQVRQALALACLASGTGVKAAGARGVRPTRSALINASNRALHAGVCACVRVCVCACVRVCLPDEDALSHAQPIALDL